MVKKRWDWLPCPACKQPSPPDATRCPVCQVDYTPEQLAKRRDMNQVTKTVGGVLGLFLIGWLIFSMAGCDEKQGEPPEVVSWAKSPVATNAVEPAEPADMKPAVIGFYKAIVAAVQPCDTATTRVAKTAEAVSKGRASVYDGYAAASSASDACGGSYSQVRDVAVPGELIGVHARAADKAKEICGDTAIAKQLAAEKAKEIFDGDTRPSQIDEYKNRSERGQIGTLACVAQIFDLAEKAGVDTALLSNAK